ncbi:MAG: YhcH/YjgK/YiaL family protein [Agathobacter sp.]
MNVQEATNYLKGLNLASLEVGKYVVDDDFYYMIQEYETQDISQCKMESHDKWIDIQWIISGVEAIETTDVSRLKVTVPYNPEKDITFFETPAVMQHNVLTEGSYVVLYPENGHMPKVAVEGSVHVKKCVAKIRV